MLCTKCSEIIKPVVGIDIDGTLGDYHNHFIKFANDYLGITSHRPGFFDLYDGSILFRDWYCDAAGISKHTWYEIKLAYRQGGMKRTMPMTAGASHLTKYVRRMGAELWLTTSRPYNRLDNIDPDTREWLSRHRIDFDHLLYDDDKYRLLSDRVDKSRVVMVLDDLFEMYDSASDIFGASVPYLFRTVWNRGVDRPHMIRSLSFDAKLAVSDAIRRWKNNHERL
jgi:hypothetical protein